MSENNEIVESPRLIDLNSKSQPRTLAALIGRDHTQLYSWAQQGRIPSPITEHSYDTMIKAIINTLIAAEGAKVLKIQENTRLREEQQARKAEERESKGQKTTKFTDFVDDGDLHPLMADKIRMTIRKDNATTIATLQKVAIERGDYISVTEMEELVKPFLITLRDTLDVIATDYPETESKLFSLREVLYNLGVQLVEKSTLDRDTLVETILETPTEDLEGIL